MLELREQGDFYVKVPLLDVAPELRKGVEFVYTDDPVPDDIITESIEETDKEFLEENIFSRAVKAVKSWFLKFINKVWNKIKTFLLSGLDVALNILALKINLKGEGYKFKGF